MASLPYVVVNNQTAMTTQLARQIKRALVVDTNPTAFAKHLCEDKGEDFTTLQVRTNRHPPVTRLECIARTCLPLTAECSVRR